MDSIEVRGCRSGSPDLRRESMNKWLQSHLGVLVLALGAAGCASPPYSQQPYRAPVVNRSTRPPQTYAQPQPVPPATAGRTLEQDPLLPREYSSSYPEADDPYAAPQGVAPANQNAYYGSVPAQPYAPESGGGSYRQPAYPPGARPHLPRPTRPTPRREPTTTAEERPRCRNRPIRLPRQGADDLYETTPSSGLLPEPQPVVPQTQSATPARPAPAPAPVPAPPAAESTVAMVAPPAAPTQPAPAPARPVPPADLPPAEISREGNQAVVALLESADKYVKSKQLDKAGAALERALRIEPRNAGIWYDLAQIRLHQGQYQQAESLATKSNNLAGDNRALQARNWKLIGASRKAAGNRAGAEEAEAHAVQLSH
jgi:tetratricopeptide (TPR) repeat protein